MIAICSSLSLHRYIYMYIQITMCRSDGYHSSSCYKLVQYIIMLQSGTIGYSSNTLRMLSLSSMQCSMNYLIVLHLALLKYTTNLIHICYYYYITHGIMFMKMFHCSLCIFSCCEVDLPHLILPVFF